MRVANSRSANRDAMAFACAAIRCRWAGRIAMGITGSVSSRATVMDERSLPGNAGRAGGMVTRPYRTVPAMSVFATASARPSGHLDLQPRTQGLAFLHIGTVCGRHQPPPFPAVPSRLHQPEWTLSFLPKPHLINVDVYSRCSYIASVGIDRQHPHHPAASCWVN
jgi:hypothetical protein